MSAVAYIHICRKRPDLKELRFEKDAPDLAAKGYKAYPLIVDQPAATPAAAQWYAPVRELLGHISDVLDDAAFGMIDTGRWNAVSLLVGSAEVSKAAVQKAEPSDTDLRALLALADRIEQAAEAPIPISADGAAVIRSVVARVGAQPAAQQDAARLDWLDQAAHCADWVDGEPLKRVIRADDGKAFHGDSWREAIDAAMKGEGNA